MVWNWRDLPLHGVRRRAEAYKPEVVKLPSGREGVGGAHSTGDVMKTQTWPGKGLCFVQVPQGGKRLKGATTGPGL